MKIILDVSAVVQFYNTSGAAMTSIVTYFRKILGFNRDRERIEAKLRLRHTFLYACSKGMVETVKECIENDVDVNCKLGTKEKNFTFVPFPKHFQIYSGDFGLILAARQNHVDVCEILLSHPKINVNNRDRRNRTALMESCSKGHSQITKLLINSPKICVNCKGFGEGLNAVMEALRFRRTGNLNCLRALAQVDGLDWNVRNNLGDTAVIWAAKNGNCESIQILKSKSIIDWNARNEECGKWSAMEIALHVRNSDLVQLLFSVPDIDIDMDPENQTYFKTHTGTRIFETEKYSLQFLVKECRKYVKDLMRDDESYNNEEFVTELVYVLRNNLDKLACILLASVSTVDILCLVSNAVTSSSSS